jgi:arylformamidase
MTDSPQILDISVPVFPGMLHPGRQPESRYMEKISNGDPGNVTRWHMGAHTGTHIEAPLHTRTCWTPGWPTTSGCC